MGLAAKMAAASAQGFQQNPQGGNQQQPYQAYGAPPQQSQGYGRPDYRNGQPPAGSAYPPQQPPAGSAYPPQQPYFSPSGGPNAPQHRPAGNSSLATANHDILFTVLKENVEENKLQAFYPDHKLHDLAKQLASRDPVGTICNNWNIPMEIGFDLIKVSLYDVVFLLDDSGSIMFMHLENELMFLLKKVAFACSLLDQDGFSVRFMNSNLQADNIRTEAQAEDLVNRVKFSGTTPLADSFETKIIGKFAPLGDNDRIAKPVMVIIITDGMPTDNSTGKFQHVIKRVRKKYNQSVAFQIAQVGTDEGAQQFLASLDSDPEVGSIIDCTSNFEMESVEFQSKSGLELTRELWYTKLLLGSIDKSYDSKDESKSNPPPSAAYGGQPQYPSQQQPAYGGSQYQPQYPPQQQPVYGGSQYAPPGQPQYIPPASPYGNGGYNPQPYAQVQHAQQQPYTGGSGGYNPQPYSQAQQQNFGARPPQQGYGTGPPQQQQQQQQQQPYYGGQPPAASYGSSITPGGYSAPPPSAIYTAPNQHAPPPSQQVRQWGY